MFLCFSRLSQQAEEYQEVIAQLQEDRRIHVNRISSLEKELMELAGTKKSAGDSKVEELRARIKIEVSGRAPPPMERSL